jgi:hypothetical protein
LLHVRGTVAELGGWHFTKDGRPRRVMPGAYRLAAPAVPFLVQHDERWRQVGWAIRMWEDVGHVWVEGLVTSEWRALDIASGHRAALSVGGDSREPTNECTDAAIDEISLVYAGADPTARIREHWWIDFADGEHIAPAQVAIVVDVRRALEQINEAALLAPQEAA